jgi:hypothetical protein
LDEHTGKDQRAFGSQLGEDVGRNVIVAADMVKLQALKVSVELVYLGALSVHQIFPDAARLVDLIDDDLGVVVSGEPLDSQGNSDA